MKVVKISFSPEAEEVYHYLNKQAPASKMEASILNALHKKCELIKMNFHYGQPIAKRLIPDGYRIKYGITNLFRVELPNYWRMLYTLVDGENEIEIIAFVLDIIDHKKYDKKFGYKKN
ncbi:type II toxin-antitoxin system RelE/ParE family toxin [Candidatus Woesearchaeota archaeon]|nr:type II toxin-antitoxin system RelE/ParE family toxin [Candidatus Woesearchaeota archaeon]